MYKLISMCAVVMVLTSCANTPTAEQVADDLTILESRRAKLPIVAMSLREGCVPYIDGTGIEEVVDSLLSKGFIKRTGFQLRGSVYTVLEYESQTVQIQIQEEGKGERKCNVVSSTDGTELLYESQVQLGEEVRDIVEQIGSEFATKTGEKFGKTGEKNTFVFHAGFFVAPRYQFRSTRVSNSIRVSFVDNRPPSDTSIKNHPN